MFFYEGEFSDFVSETFEENVSIASVDSLLSKNDKGTTTVTSEDVTAFGLKAVKISRVSLLSQERGVIDSVYGGEVVNRFKLKSYFSFAVNIIKRDNP